MRQTRTAMLISVAALVGALAVSAQAHEPKPKPTPSPVSLPAAAQDAAAAVDAFHAALVRGDTGAAVALLADDVLIYESGGVERSKAEYIGHHLGGDAAFAKAVSRATVRRTGGVTGQLAWIATEGQVTGSYRERKIDSVTTETMLLRKDAKDWKIIHIHWSSAGRK